MELGCTQGVHDSVEDTELTGSEGTNHDATWDKTNGAELVETNLLGNIGETGQHWTITSGTGLVDLGEEGIGRMRDNRSGNSSNDTGTEGDSKVGSRGEFVWGLAHCSVHGVGNVTLDSELSHGVWNLLGKNWEETRVETHDTFVLGHFCETVGEAVAELWVRDGADANGLKRAKENIGNSFGASSGDEVDGGLVLPGLLFSETGDNVDLDKLHSSELEPTLDEVSDGGSTKTGSKSHGSLFGNDLTESSDKTPVVLSFESIMNCLSKGKIKCELGWSVTQQVGKVPVTGLYFSTLQGKEENGKQ
jgi:hypothetical protein